MLRRFLISLAFLLGTVCASAQWYLFPGSGHTVDSAAVSALQVDTVTVEEPSAFDGVRTAVLLPLRSRGNASANFLEFYAGVLLAARDLAAGGTRVLLDVVDIVDDSLMASSAILDSSDVIIGPVSVPDISRYSIFCPSGRCMVSPLDPKAVDLMDVCNLIQAPASWESQIDELVSWLGSEKAVSDSVILLQNDMEEGGEMAPYLVSRLNESGIPYTISGDPAAIQLPVGGCGRFLLVSDNDSFCANCVREIGLRAVKEENVTVYGISRLRSISEIEAASLHVCGARITAGYFVDQNDPKVRSFYQDYLAMFHAEPGSFAYQGYDLTTYFVSLSAMYGRGWELYLTDHPWSGLHTSFRFDDAVRAGRVNTAVRRLRYRDDNSITIESR